MWLLLLSMARADEKAEGDLPDFSDLKPVISCCVDREILNGAVKEKADDIRACMTGTGGRGTLQWTITPAGTVEAVSSTSQDAERDACLEEVVETMTFPAINCTLIVKYPLVFSS